MRKLLVENVNLIKKMLKDGVDYKDIAVFCETSPENVRCIDLQYSWRDEHSGPKGVKLSGREDRRYYWGRDK